MKTEDIKKLSDTLREAADNAERLTKAMGTMGGPAKMQICGDLALIEVADVRKTIAKDLPVASPEDFDRSYNIPGFLNWMPESDSDRAHAGRVLSFVRMLNKEIDLARSAGLDVTLSCDGSHVSPEIIAKGGPV